MKFLLRKLEYKVNTGREIQLLDEYWSIVDAKDLITGISGIKHNVMIPQIEIIENEYARNKNNELYEDVVSFQIVLGFQMFSCGIYRNYNAKTKKILEMLLKSQGPGDIKTENEKVLKEFIEYHKLQD